MDLKELIGKGAVFSESNLYFGIKKGARYRITGAENYKVGRVPSDPADVKAGIKYKGELTFKLDNYNEVSFFYPTHTYKVVE